MTERAVPHALIAEADSVITVTLNRPERLNPISPDVTETLWQAVRALGDRSDLRAMVITAKGRYFTAGLDLVTRHGGRLPGPDAQAFGWRRGYRSHHLLYDEIEAVEKPVVVAANGPVVGAGVEMAVSCDFRFCTPDAHWQLPETTMGSLPGSGGVSRLTRLVGTHWAKWMAWAGMAVGAEQAHTIGLAHDVYPAEELSERVADFVRRLVNLSAETAAAAKLAIDLCDPLDREKARNVERLANTDLVHRGHGGRSSDYQGASGIGRDGSTARNG